MNLGIKLITENKIKKSYRIKYSVSISFSPTNTHLHVLTYTQDFFTTLPLFRYPTGNKRFSKNKPVFTHRQ